MDQQINNKPIESAQTKKNWWPLWVGLAAFLLGPVWGIIANLVAQNDRANGDTASAINLGLPAAILSIAGIIVATIALKKDRRSAIVWAGLVLSLLSFAYFAYIGIGELSS